ncbi:MAG TPA: GGDEF domain-containing protein [Pyrinomonadaceae bacterium]|jgi:diguanylate cyclase (GGDEF)-like protein|nr:GGDEF domain-containing protein [Pyrinomonadaceae bacterium]
MEREELETTLPADPPASHERRPALVFMRGEQLAAPIPLERDEVILGRALEADVRVNDARASRMHARIRIEHDPETNAARYRLTDLGSTNGTLLNGQPVSDAFLQHGDKLNIGEHLIRFDLLDDFDREFQRQLYRLIAHDELTGLLTSKSFFSELRREAARAESEGRPFCVLMMDLDHFKRVNDTCGHLVGSQTLEEIGGLITRALRAGDVAARFGGEEFAAFLLDADCAQALVAAERVRTAIEEHAFSATRHGAASAAEENRTLRITISIGVAAYPDDARDPIELIELADTALYHAKQSGRNRVSAFCCALDDATPRELRPRAVPRSE